MKKLIVLVLSLAFVFSLISCSNRSLDDIIHNEPSISGIVKEITEDAILIESDNCDYWISLKVKNKDNVTSFYVGDEIIVYYNGNAAESNPTKINKVYAITLKMPTEAKNDNA